MTNLNGDIGTLGTKPYKDIATTPSSKPFKQCIEKTCTKNAEYSLLVRHFNQIKPFCKTHKEEALRTGLCKVIDLEDPDHVSKKRIHHNANFTTAETMLNQDHQKPNEAA